MDDNSMPHLNHQLLTKRRKTKEKTLEHTIAMDMLTVKWLYQNCHFHLHLIDLVQESLLGSAQCPNAGPD
jgi:hypothetical protein